MSANPVQGYPQCQIPPFGARPVERDAWYYPRARDTPETVRGERPKAAGVWGVVVPRMLRTPLTCPRVVLPTCSGWMAGQIAVTFELAKTANYRNNPGD